MAGENLGDLWETHWKAVSGRQLGNIHLRFSPLVWARCWRYMLLIRSYVCLCLRSIVCLWLVCLWLVCLLVCLFACLFVSPFLRLFVCHWFVCSFVCPIVCLLVCMFFCSFVCLFVVMVLVGTLKPPWAHHGHPLGSLGHRLGTLGPTLGTLWAPWDTPATILTAPWATLGIAGATFGSSGAALRHTLDTPWKPFLPSWKHVPKKLKKTTTRTHLFHLFWRRMHMQSDHACAVQTHIRALFLTLFYRPQKNAKGGSLDDFKSGASATHLR